MAHYRSVAKRNRRNNKYLPRENPLICTDEQYEWDIARRAGRGMGGYACGWRYYYRYRDGGLLYGSMVFDHNGKYLGEYGNTEE